MDMDQNQTPLYDALAAFKKRRLDSFHVPGHKNGKIFSKRGKDDYQSILEMDVTEITGMDDLHAPDGIIKHSQQLAADFFGSDQTFFLINGTTAGNLAMILTVCSPGDQVLVQRNSHKSIMNGLELAGAKPVFLSPEFEKETNRYSKVSPIAVEEAIRCYPDLKAIILTYPDYFGRVYDLETIIRISHVHQIPVMVDEAHGVHFHLGGPFPSPALASDADVVVQSAHKMAPAMTMASYLHVNSSMVDADTIRHYLQIVQSSSPSYPLMASLDLARHFLTTIKSEDIEHIIQTIQQIRRIFAEGIGWKVLPSSSLDDPLKITLQVRGGWSGFDVAKILEGSGIYPELATSDQILLILGLGTDVDQEKLANEMKEINDQLKILPRRDTIKGSIAFPHIKELVFSYMDMKAKKSILVNWEEAVGKVAAQSVIPYPPGIPLIMKGEQITRDHLHHIEELVQQGATFQNDHVHEGLFVFI
jgi:arginine decarboxylase